MEKYFYEAFEKMERLGPGSESSTLKACGHIDTTRKVKILDIGCGVGAHTLLIAKKYKNFQITAIDNNQEYIDKLNKKANELGLNNQVLGVCMSMFEMSFEEKSFDYIYSEGAIYISGFTNGLEDWKRFLKPEGKLICSEITWLVDDPSETSLAYWNENYSQMDSIENKIIQAKKLGYKDVDHFVLPKEDWIDNYYSPLEKQLRLMKSKYNGLNEEASNVIMMIEEEIEMYKNYGNEYSYVFYILQNK